MAATDRNGFKMQHVATEKLIYSIREAANMLGCSRNMMYRCINKGLIPGTFRLGGSWKIAKKPFDKWLQDPSKWEEMQFLISDK